VIGATRFYDRREVKDLLAYLRVLVNPSDEVSARRIVNVPRRGIGDRSVDRLALWARSEGRTFADAFGDPEAAGLTGRPAVGLRSLAEILDALRQMMAEGAKPAELVAAVSDRTGYREGLENEGADEANDRLENLDELMAVAAGYDDLDTFLESVALVSDADEVATDGTQVSLMTLHIAKGLEFAAVFLVGMEDGIFPHLRSLDDPAKLEEERRLCYVGITRARQFLYLSHAWSRTVWGSTSHAIPSRFLSEVPDGLVRDVGLSLVRRPDPRSPVPARSRVTSPSSRVFDDDDDPFAEHPYGDSERVPSASSYRRPPDRTPPRAPAAGTRRTGRPVSDGPPRKSRLPKMAQWKFGEGNGSH
jgi:DNA helicase-2/ATP-dependent DNA helicase PcrA